MQITFKHSIDEEGRESWDARVLMANLVAYPHFTGETFVAQVCGLFNKVEADEAPFVSYGHKTLAEAQLRTVELARHLYAAGLEQLAGDVEIETLARRVPSPHDDRHGSDSTCVLSDRHAGTCSPTFAGAEVGH